MEGSAPPAFLHHQWGHCSYGPFVKGTRTLAGEHQSLYRYVRYETDLSSDGMNDLGLTHTLSKKQIIMDNKDSVPVFTCLGELSGAKQVRVDDHFDGFLD